MSICSLRLLQRERMQMLQRMHRHLALIHLSASLKHWTNYTCVYKAKRAFLQRRRTSTIGHRTRSMLFPLIASLNQNMRVSQSLGDNDFQVRSLFLFVIYVIFVVCRIYSFYQRSIINEANRSTIFHR